MCGNERLTRHSLERKKRVSKDQKSAQEINLRLKSFKEPRSGKSRSFLFIDESHLEDTFKNPVINGQILSHFNEENDYDSDKGTVTKN